MLGVRNRAAVDVGQLVPGQVAEGRPRDLRPAVAPAALDAASRPISTIMAPIRGAVQVSDSLSTVISSMLRHGIDLVPVLEGQRVAGVVLMTNIFDIVAQFVLEHGAPKSQGEP
jgi:signal-transduction protein with cAMP-binding, CBS, and nucleotidyltransferase domain